MGDDFEQGDDISYPYCIVSIYWHRGWPVLLGCREVVWSTYIFGNKYSEHELDINIIKQLLLNITVSKLSYTKTCFCSLYITWHQSISFCVRKLEFLMQAMFLPAILKPGKKGDGHYSKIGGYQNGGME